MAAMIIRLGLYFWINYFIVVNYMLNCDGSKLNVPKLLLPYFSQVAANFTLEASDGCFTWRSSRPEVATVHPVGTKDPLACSRTAVVTPVSTVPSRKTSVVTAEETGTGQQLRCDVIIDKISDMYVETTTRELFLDDSPEEFVIRARNDKDDVFSSLDDMLFNWTLEPDTKSGNNQNPADVIRLLKFAESSYAVLPHVKLLEDNGKRGDRILMQGLHTGAAWVTVKPVDPVYQHLTSFRVRVLVVANLQLSPSVSYILQHATVTYKVELLKQGKAFEIEMPSDEYLLEVENASIARLDVSTSTVTGIEFGFTEIKLRDQSHKPSDTDTIREPSSGIYVVNPANLKFTSIPDENWVFETNKSYTIYVNVLDSDGKKIYSSENLRVAANFSDGYFRVIDSSQNGTYYVVETLKRGFTNLDAQLNSILSSSGKHFMFEKPVRGSQAVEIYDPVVLLPEVVAFPWEPTGKSIRYQMKVSGGSGNYSFDLNDSSIVVVKSTGVLVVGSRVGSTLITAFDLKNERHKDSSEVHVLPPSHIEFIPSRVEAEIGSELRLPFAVYGRLGDDEFKFEECHLLAFKVFLSVQNIYRKISVDPSSVDDACAELVLEASNVGHVEVIVTYDNDNVKLKATLVIASYQPLTPLDPKDLAVVTLGSSVDLIFDGGPRPWILDSSGFFLTVGAEKRELVSLTEAFTSDVSKHHHSFTVSCSKLGEQLINLTVGNEPTTKNLFPVTATAGIMFACEVPKGLRLAPLLEQPDSLSPCPISPDLDPVPVPLNSDVVMEALLTDRHGRKFSNFSSLVVEWKLSDLKLGQLVNDSNQVPYRLSNPNADHKTIALSEKIGRLTVTVEINRHVGGWLSGSPITPPIIKSRILELVDYPSFLPSRIIMFNHRQIKAALSVISGSGHFKFDKNDSTSEIVRSKVDASDPRNISLFPINEGSTSMSITDLCLTPVRSSIVEIFVSDIAEIVLQVPDKVERNKEIEANVRMVDGNGLSIDMEYFSLMNIQAITRSDIISVKVSSKSADRVTTVYVVHGISLGRTYLQVSAIGKDGQKILSLPKEIQVFPPLKLKPKNITIIPQTSFQVVAIGGPQPDSSNEFYINNVTVATVNSVGLIRASELGTTTIVAMSVGTDADGNRFVFSQDSARVMVVELTGVKIIAPLKRILSGSQMPLYAVGNDINITPFSFASVAPPLEFSWIIDKEQVAHVRPVYHRSGVEPLDMRNFAMRFHAKSSGDVTITLHVTSSNLKNTMTSTLTVTVFDDLSFLSPPRHDGSVLMMPNTEMYIKTNRDGSAAEFSYAVIDVDGARCSSDKPPVVKVSKYGLVTSTSYTGQSHLQVTAQEEFGINRTKIVLVEVKALSYIMVNTETIMKSHYPGISSFPTNAQIDFYVSFHDNVGEEFYATRSNIRCHLNKQDQVKLMFSGNKTFSADTNSPGFTVLKVFENSNSLIADYVGIPVDCSIAPCASQVTLGSIICFTSLLRTGEGHAGDWLTTGESVEIDRMTGIASANRIGLSTVSYNVSYVATQTSVEVLSITTVTLKQTGSLGFLTDVEDKINFNPSFIVSLENTAIKLKSEVYGSGCTDIVRGKSLNRLTTVPFSCHLTFTKDNLSFEVYNLMKTTPVFDTKSGQLMCLVTMEKMPPLAKVSALDTSVVINAVVRQQDGQDELESEDLVIPFHPAFFIHDRDVFLTTTRPDAELRITASPAVYQELQVISSDEYVIRVRSPSRRDNDENVYFFPLTLQSYSWSTERTQVNVTVKCVLTGQLETLSIRIAMADKKEMTWTYFLSSLIHEYYNIFFFLVCIIATISCLIIAYHLIQSQKQHYASATTTSAFISPGSTPGPNTPAYSNGSPSQRLWTQQDRSPYASGPTRYRNSPRS